MACPEQPYAPSPQPKTRPRNSSAKATCAATAGMVLHRARLSRSRVKAPRNPDLRRRPEHEAAGQAPVPYPREAPTSVSMAVSGEIDEPRLGGLRAQHQHDRPTDRLRPNESRCWVEKAGVARRLPENGFAL